MSDSKWALAVSVALLSGYAGGRFVGSATKEQELESKLAQARLAAGVECNQRMDHLTGVCVQQMNNIERQALKAVINGN